MATTEVAPNVSTFKPGTPSQAQKTKEPLSPRENILRRKEEQLRILTDAERMARSGHPDLAAAAREIRKKREHLKTRLEALPEVKVRRETVHEIFAERLPFDREFKKARAEMAMNARFEKQGKPAEYPFHSPEELTELKQELDTRMEQIVQQNIEVSRIKQEALENDPAIRGIAEDIADDLLSLNGLLEAQRETLLASHKQPSGTADRFFKDARKRKAGAPDDGVPGVAAGDDL